jgi:hypothetical protein
VPARELLLAVRHHDAAGERGHTWTQQPDGQAVEEKLRDHPLHDAGPEALLPAWALQVYRELRLGKTSSASPGTAGWCPWPHPSTGCPGLEGGAGSVGVRSTLAPS